MDTTGIFLEHITISVVPWIVGTLLGSGTGYLAVLAFRRQFSSHPRLHRIAALVPWRTPFVLLAAAAIFSPYTLTFFGVGVRAGVVSVALFSFDLALPFTTSTLLGQWFPQTTFERLAGTFRNLGVIAITAAILVSLMGAGGAGFPIWTGMREYDYTRMWTGYGIVFAIALALELILGTAQFLLSQDIDAKERGFFVQRNASSR